MFWIASVLALVIGIALGLLGGGGSILTVPILRYVLNMPAHEAIAVSLFIVGITSMAALVPHARLGNVRWRTGIVFGSAGMLGAFLAGRVSHWLPASVLLIGFGLMMLATGIAMLRPKRDAASTADGRNAPVTLILAEGLVVGAVTGLVGAGGGFLVVPALVLLARLPMAAAVGTSLLVIAAKSLAGFAGYWSHTTIDWRIALPIAGIAVLGSVLGSALTAKIPARALRAAFGWFVVVMAFFMLAQELPAVFGFQGGTLLALAVALVGTALLASLGVSGRFVRRRNGGEPTAAGLGTNRVSPATGGESR